MFAIEIQGLAKDYAVGFWKKQLRPALKPLNLAIKAGETFGFLGPNGAGKTTTLKLLMSIISPTSGTATILGKSFLDPEVKRRIGFLPEQPYFYDYLSAHELLDYYARLSGVSLETRKQKIDGLLNRVGLGEVGNRQLRKFSKGMLQRVGIAQAIIHDPEVVFLDEPMSEGKTIFFSTHILSDAEALCDRVAVIHKGELRGIGAINEIRTSVAGRSEVIWDGAHALSAVSSSLIESHVTGETVRGTIRSEDVDSLLEQLRRERARLISVTPLHGTLEEYFLARTAEREKVIS